LRAMCARVRIGNSAFAHPTAINLGGHTRSRHRE
jgi:hypothetical protein